MDAPLAADAALVEYLSALANVNRLGVVRALRTPKALREIVVKDEGAGPVLARQSIRRHLGVLLDAGVVTSREAGRDYGDTSEFVVNHQRLFAISEEVRNLARLRPTVEIAVDTVPRRASARPVEAGPSLVLVRGLDEGQRFDLTPGPSRTTWIVGRRRGLDVALDFDPSTSSENSIIRWDGGHHTLEDVEGSLNGTIHNFRQLAPRESVRLRHGDILGVGRCLLVYWN